jgi:RimJ/RimL family protein N-acetyltransferase
VGTVRIDFDGSAYELSWTVAPAARGRNVGKTMVLMAARELNGPVRAQIKTSNVASIRIAEAAGLHFVGEQEGMLQYERP